jgi:hypothetical protein
MQFYPLCNRSLDIRALVYAETVRQGQYLRILGESCGNTDGFVLNEWGP